MLFSLKNLNRETTGKIRPFCSFERGKIKKNRYAVGKMKKGSIGKSSWRKGGGAEIRRGGAKIRRDGARVSGS